MRYIGDTVTTKVGIIFQVPRVYVMTTSETTGGRSSGVGWAPVDGRFRWHPPSLTFQENIFNWFLFNIPTFYLSAIKTIERLKLKEFNSHLVDTDVCVVHLNSNSSRFFFYFLSFTFLFSLTWLSKRFKIILRLICYIESFMYFSLLRKPWTTSQSAVLNPSSVHSHVEKPGRVARAANAISLLQLLQKRETSSEPRSSSRWNLMDFHARAVGELRRTDHRIPNPGWCVKRNRSSANMFVYYSKMRYFRKRARTYRISTRPKCLFKIPNRFTI